VVTAAPRRSTGANSGRSQTIIAFVMIVVAVGLSGSSRAGAIVPRTSSGYAVPAVPQPLTTDPSSPVAHDTENDVLVAQGPRLFASTDQWEYPGSPAYGQILVKNSATAPWKVFEETQGLRVEDSMASFPIPQDQGLGRGHSLLITVATLNGRTELQWLLDGARSFAPADSFPLPSDVIDVRSFGAHETGGVWSVYAGVDPTGILRATWSKSRHTLVFGPTPELTEAMLSSPSLVSQKVTAFANCRGALYATVNTRLYRRNDGSLPSGTPRWSLLYEEPPVGPHNSGLRGLTCVVFDGAQVLLLSTEGDGDVYRLDHLPQGRVGRTTSVRPGHPAAGLAVSLEFSPIPAIRHMLAEDGASVPASGKGSIVYVIAAYNRFTTVRIAGVTRQLVGFEWAYAGPCPTTRTCGPISARLAQFDAAACFAVRTGSSGTPNYVLRCLSGSDFKPTGRSGPPIRAGQAYVSIRTIALSPFGDGRIYYGGYDCNFYPADGTAWVASSTTRALRLSASGRTAARAESESGVSHDF
jgi:hypothetical protein